MFGAEQNTFAPKTMKKKKPERPKSQASERAIPMPLHSFAPLLGDEVSVSLWDVFVQRGPSSGRLLPTAPSVSTGNHVRTSNWHDIRAKQWDDITLHYLKCYFSSQLLPLCEGLLPIGIPFPCVLRDCFTIDRCGLFLEEAQVWCQG